MYTYIIIDDESLIRKGTIKKLEGISDKISCIGEASNGQEGLQLIKDVHPDCVILDMQMPIMDGTQLLPFLAEKYPKMPLVVISGFRDFDYMKTAIAAQAVDYVLKPFSKETICDCLLKAIDKIAGEEEVKSRLTLTEDEKETALYEFDIQYLTNLIHGYNQAGSTLSSQKLKYINDTHDMVLFTLSMSEDIHGLKVGDWLDEAGFGDLVLFLPDSSDAFNGFLIFFMPEHTIKPAEQLIKQITDSLFNYARELSIGLTIGVSRIHHDLSDLHVAFEETAEALNQQLVANPGIGTYIYQKEYGPKNIVWDKEDEFLFRVESGSTEEVKELVLGLFTWFKSVQSLNLTDVKYYCFLLSVKCSKLLNFYMNQPGSSGSPSMQNIIQHIFKIDELENYYRQFFCNISDMLKDESIYSSEDLIEKIKYYIDHNYEKNLTQEFIASLFYLNRSYLSTLFKQKTGMKFIDYLNDLRLEKAANLLVSTDKKMYQIAKSVGYDNTKYFFRVFKKKYLVTPEQYRTTKGLGPTAP
ncbi:MAG: response regulator [Pseudobutyrivibrio sp.]|nr:response regulator [Pseudobutyrivibrio sp.]